MKSSLIILICSFMCVMIWGGCESDKHINSVVSGDNNGQLPEFLVGTWEAYGDEWQFTFEADGTISSLVHGAVNPFGPTK